MRSWLSIRLLNLEIPQKSQTQAVDDSTLDRSDSFVHGVSAKWRTYDDPVRALTGCSVHNRVDRVRYVIWFRGVCSLKQVDECLDDFARNFCDFAIRCSASCICRLLSRGVHIRGVSARLNKNDVDAQL